MRQYQLTEPYLQYPKGQIFVGQYPIKGQSAKCYVTPDNIPGPDGAEVCLFASFVESSPIFKEETKNPDSKAGDPLTK